VGTGCGEGGAGAGRGDYPAGVPKHGSSSPE